MARRLPWISTQSPKRGIDYPVTFRIDPDAPLGFTLLDGEAVNVDNEELVGV